MSDLNKDIQEVSENETNTVDSEDIVTSEVSQPIETISETAGQITTETSSLTDNKKNSFAHGLIEQLELIVVAFAIIILIFSFIGRTCEVKGESMENTLLDKDMVLISNMFYTPDRGDIIVFHQTGNRYNEPIVKRVIGLPGDTVKIEYLQATNQMKVTVTDSDGNSTVLSEKYIKYNGPRYYEDQETYVTEGTIFVMGDNRSNSADSRDVNIGLVDTRRVLGKVIFRVFPFSEMGPVK